MLSMLNFGNNGRLGNQMFQYAFMRTQANRLRCSLFLPKWIGNGAFQLNDASIRCYEIPRKGNIYRQIHSDCGFDPVLIKPNTDVSGYFQSEMCFDQDLIKEAYKFDGKILSACQKYIRDIDIDRDQDVCVGIRLGDFAQISMYYVPNLGFYTNALKILSPRRIFLFSDDINSAESILRKTGPIGAIVPVIADPIGQLAIMAHFKKFIIGPSTFSWWGAWLAQEDKTVIVPKEGPLRPGSPVHASHYWPSSYIQIKSLNFWQRYNPVRYSRAVRRFVYRASLNSK